MRPKSREETPKEGSGTATPIAIPQCNIYLAPHKMQAEPAARSADAAALNAWVVMHPGRIVRRERGGRCG